MDALPFSQACENNKQPIFQILSRHLTDEALLLEIAGGTGQHAVHFARHLPQIQWQTSDIQDTVDSLDLRISHANLPNLPNAISLDVNEAQWHSPVVDAVFTANSLHIISKGSVRNLFSGVGRHLQTNGLLFVYGPFKYNGDFTTESNARFDLWLKGRDPVSGVRDIEWVNDLADDQGLELLEDNPMPANNQLLVWCRNKN